MVVAVVLVLGACGNGTVVLPAGKSKDALAGDYVGSGANSANLAMATLIKQFALLHPGVNFRLNDADTESSIVNVTLGVADFGYIGRELRATESGALIPIGVTGTGIAVNAVNPITNLSKEQIAKIYTGAITDWSAVGSNAGVITPFVRESGSATRMAMEAYVFTSTPKYGVNVQEVFESADMTKALGAFQGAIGAVTMNKKNLKDATFKLVALDGTQPTLANLQNGVWKLTRRSYMTTNADPAKVKPAVKALVDFIQSAEGQKILSGE
jgi:phosphate transport system substrate-binding protein